MNYLNLVNDTPTFKSDFSSLWGNWLSICFKLKEFQRLFWRILRIVSDLSGYTGKRLALFMQNQDINTNTTAFGHFFPFPFQAIILPEVHSF